MYTVRETWFGRDGKPYASTVLPGTYNDLDGVQTITARLNRIAHTLHDMVDGTAGAQFPNYPVWYEIHIMGSDADNERAELPAGHSDFRKDYDAFGNYTAYVKGELPEYSFFFPLK